MRNCISSYWKVAEVYEFLTKEDPENNHKKKFGQWQDCWHVGVQEG